MALYRFRINFEDYDDVIREIDIKSNQTFADLHDAIHKSTGYNSDYSSSFFVSNDQWTKGEEIAYKPSQRKIDRGVALMENSKLSNFIDDPHQKFYYTFNFERPFDFHVELIKILTEVAGTNYPVVVKSAGEAPKQFGNTFNPTILPPTSEDFDFLNEMEYTPEDTEDFVEVKNPVADTDDHEEGHDDAEGEEDEFGDEFSDNESFDDDEFGGGRKSGSHDDY